MRRIVKISFKSKISLLENEFKKTTGYTRRQKPELFYQFASVKLAEYNCRMQERILAELMNIRDQLFMVPDMWNEN